MLRDYNIIFLTEQKELFYSFLKFLTSIESPNNPCLINSADDLGIVKISKIELIICDTEINHGLIDLAFGLLEIHPKFIPVILLISNKFIDDFNRPIIHATAILDPINMWETNWPAMCHIKKMWETPFLNSVISRSTTSDILQMIGHNRWDAGVRCMGIQNGEKIKGCIFFKNGMPLYAWSTNQSGLDAALELLTLQTGILEVIKDINFLPVQNIYCTLEEILITNALGYDSM